MKALIKTPYYKKIFFALAFAIYLVSAGVLKGSAQQSEPQFLVTWSAKSYVPPQFKGKILPAAGSLVTVSFELLDNGKLIDLSRPFVYSCLNSFTGAVVTHQDVPVIYWYLNDVLVKGGTNQQTVAFYVPTAVSGALDLKIQIPNYEKGCFSDFVFSETQIPVASPEVVIEAPYPNGNFTTTSFVVTGVPYFFGVASPAELSYTWNVNGETPPNAENPEELNVALNPDAPSGSTVSIGLSIQNPKNPSESGGASLGLTYLK